MENHIAFCFGRINPPTIGHKLLFDTAATHQDYKIFVSQSQDKKNNPLSYHEKINFIKLIYPEHASAVVEDETIKTVLHAASYLYNIGYRNVTLVAGSDRTNSMVTLLQTYNGVTGKPHGFYNFNSISTTSCGNRSSSTFVSQASGTKARLAAKTNDFDTFSNITSAKTYTKSLYDAVKKGLSCSD